MSVRLVVAIWVQSFDPGSIPNHRQQTNIHREDARFP